MVKRRTTVMGIGALAMGSGAAFTGAGFQNSVDSSADMRVVVDEQLTVRAGSMFSSLSAENYSDNSGEPFKAVVSQGGNYTPANVLFDSDEVFSGYSSVTATDDTTIPTPAAVVNDGEDGNFAFAVAVGLNESISFSDLIEVENTSASSADVGITFSGFGGDASAVGGSPGGEEAVATQIYQFEDSGGAQISTDSTGWTDSSTQDPANKVSIGPGDIEQITLQNNTGGGSGISAGNIRSAISSGGTPSFGTTLTGVDLVNTIEVGAGSDGS